MSTRFWLVCALLLVTISANAAAPVPKTPPARGVFVLDDCDPDFKGKDRYADNLRKLRLIYVDCGTKDEFALHWGARALVTRMRRCGLSPFYEEFDDGHMSIPYRYDVSLPLLVRALTR